MSKKKKFKSDEPISNEPKAHEEDIHSESVEASHEELTSEMIPYDNGVELVEHPLMSHKKFDKFKGEKK